MNNDKRISTHDEYSNGVHGQATGGAPMTPVLKPVITNGASELGTGKIVTTMHDQATGKMECETDHSYESKEAQPASKA